MSSTSAPEHQIIEQTIKMPLSDYELIVENNRMLRQIIGKIQLKEWLTTEEAAIHINRSVSHLRGRLKNKIGFRKVGKELDFRRSDLDRCLMKDYKPGKE